MGKLSAAAPLSAQLDEFLSEDVNSAILRQQTAFDSLTAPFCESLVLVGAGNLGRQLLAKLRLTGIEPLAFADNNPALWNARIDGLPVLPVPDAVADFADKAAFVVAIVGDGKPIFEVTQQLRELGCRRIATFCHLFWKYPERFLPWFSVDSPHKVYLQAEEIRKVFSLWADDASRREFLVQLKWRTFLDFESLSAPADRDIYFPDDLTAVSSDEVFVDCGAFDGDTLRTFLRRQGSSFSQYIALEPDAANFEKLKHFVGKLPEKFQEKIATHQLATGSRRQTVRFNATGTHGSSVGAGTAEVEMVSLDEFLSDRTPTYIKMDIEGSEIDTLWGAKKIIEQRLPVLAISVYHRPDDLWKIPSLVHSLSDRYRFFLRPHAFAVWDCVLYAIPASRLAV